MSACLADIFFLKRSYPERWAANAWKSPARTARPSTPPRQLTDAELDMLERLDALHEPPEPPS